MPKALHSSTPLAQSGLHPLTLDPILEHALREDWAWGDLTSTLIVPPDVAGRAEFLFKQDGVVAGLPVVERIFHLVDPTIAFRYMAQDGDRLRKGTIAAEAEGSARSLLMAERVALNLLQRMSATATLARTYSDALKGTRTQLLDTRKTTPGLRLLEKYAVRVGGGRNHRYGLADAIMIKDNHIAIAGSITEAVRRARAGAPMTIRIEVETESLDMVREALAAGADIIMLDNMAPETMREAVALIDGKALTEASGGITLPSIRRVAEAGVDFISVGALTHSAGSLDISLDLHTA
jgi:nicotinate-nucleotide pyrophosphorylase (carboxylating)